MKRKPESPGHARITALRDESLPELERVALATWLLEQGLLKAERDGLYYGERTDFHYGTYGTDPFEQDLRRRWLVAYAQAPAPTGGVTGRGIDIIYAYLVDGQAFDSLVDLCTARGEGRRLLDVLLRDAGAFRPSPTVTSAAVERFLLAFAVRGMAAEAVIAADRLPKRPSPRSAQVRDLAFGVLADDTDPTRQRLAAGEIAYLESIAADGSGFPLRAVIAEGMEPARTDRLLAWLWHERGYNGPQDERLPITEGPFLSLDLDIAEMICMHGSPALRARLYLEGSVHARRWLTRSLMAEDVALITADGHDLAADGSEGAMELLTAARTRPRMLSARRVDELALLSPEHRAMALRVRLARARDAKAIGRVRDAFAAAWIASEPDHDYPSERYWLTEAVADWPPAKLLAKAGPRPYDAILRFEVADLPGKDRRRLPERLLDDDVDGAVGKLVNEALGAAFACSWDEARAAADAFGVVARAARKRLLRKPGIADRGAASYLGWLALADAVLASVLAEAD